MDGNGESHQLFQARLGNIDAIIAAGVAVERLSLGLGVNPLEASRFRFAVEELCTERVSHAFAPGEEPEAHLALELRPGELAVIILDTGSPIDATDAAAGAKGWLAQLLGRGFADRLHASFEGREGNRCEVVKLLGKSIRSELSTSSVGGSATRAEVEADDGSTAASAIVPRTEIKYREMAPEDALGVARCFYRTYGFTAPIADEVIYHPDRLAARVTAGLHIATVATLPDGRIVGHLAISREHLNDPVGISGFLVVDPEYRGRGIAITLSDQKIARGRLAGMRGLLGMAVTVHTASQKTSLREGGHEVGVLLAAQEDRVVMRGIARNARHERHAMMPFFISLVPDTNRQSFPPECHRTIVESIYAACGLDRTLGRPAPLSFDTMPEHTAIDVSVIEGARFARIRIGTYGRDFVREILHIVEDLHRHHVNVIRLEMPLADPLTAHFGHATEELGFSFAAVFPAMEAGDLLCVQSLDRVEVDPTAIRAASKHGAEVLSAVLASRERVMSSTTARTLEGATLALETAGRNVPV
jgi:anti-sigma regulatory factor (Ser/Thr protein kinase)/GNAT superfamily N-acetyltransferase